MSEQLTYYGKILSINKNKLGWLVSIDLFDNGNCTFYLHMNDEPKGTYLKYYTKMNIDKPEYRIVVE